MSTLVAIINIAASNTLRIEICSAAENTQEVHLCVFQYAGHTRIQIRRIFDQKQRVLSVSLVPHTRKVIL